MLNRSIKKMFITTSILFVLTFFFVIEWRWQAMLLGAPDFKPHIVAAIMAVFVIFMAMSSMEQRPVGYWLIFFLIIYFVLISIVNINGLNHIPEYKLSTEFGNWCINLALFVTASDKRFVEYIYQHQKFMLVMYVLFILPLFLILFYSGTAVQSHFNLREAIYYSGLSTNSDYGVSYQSIGDKIAILTFIVLSLNINHRLKAVVFLSTILALYVAGSKASMVGYLFACISSYLIIAYRNRYYIKSLAIFAVAISIVCLGVLYIVNNSTSLQNSNNWFIRAVASGKEDISVSGRHNIELENQVTRKSRILLGDYKFDYKYGRPGSYTHNAIGIIDYFGLPVFVICIILWLYYLFLLLRYIRGNTYVVHAALMAMLFYSLLFIIARLPLLYLTYWTLGMSMAVYQCKGKNIKKNKVGGKHV